VEHGAIFLRINRHGGLLLRQEIRGCNEPKAKNQSVHVQSPKLLCPKSNWQAAAANRRDKADKANENKEKFFLEKTKSAK
jgi:hypothetical protein